MGPEGHSVYINILEMKYNPSQGCSERIRGLFLAVKMHAVSYAFVPPRCQRVHVNIPAQHSN